MQGMPHFFVSYTASDRAIAEWIASVLVEERFSVLFQAWDMRGNFVAAMNAAMIDCERVVLVMSAEALASDFVAAEWMSALRRDPRGTEDRLVVFRVGDCMPQGWLAQIAFTDLLAEPDEASMRRAIVQRVRGARPAGPVPFPGLGGATPARALALPAPFPAAEHDARRARRLRPLVAAWRRQWALRMPALDAAAAAARQASRGGGGADGASVFALAAEVAGALEALPMRALEAAGWYGLHIHDAVLDGGAAGLVRSHLRLGADAGEPSAYDWENAARLLEAAQALQRFDLDRLPQGYRVADAVAPPPDLRSAGSLLLLRVADEPGLRVARATAGGAPVGRLVARARELRVLAARLDDAGRLEVIASDDESLLAFRAGSPLPTAEQRPPEGFFPLAAWFDGAEAVRVLGADGSLRAFGDGHVLVPPGPGQTAWRDDEGGWHVLGLDRPGACHRRGADGSAARVALPFGPPGWPDYEPAIGPLWNDVFTVTIGRLGGLPVALVWRASGWGAALAFLDPLTLEPLREPLFVPHGQLTLLSATIAGGRWLLLTGVQHGSESAPRLVVHDLERGGIAPAPVLQALSARGDLAEPVLLQAGRDGFALCAVLSDFAATEPDRGSSLLHLAWPPVQQSVWLEARSLKAWPVAR